MVGTFLFILKFFLAMSMAMFAWMALLQPDLAKARAKLWLLTWKEFSQDAWNCSKHLVKKITTSRASRGEPREATFTLRRKL